MCRLKKGKYIKRTRCSAVASQFGSFRLIIILAAAGIFMVIGSVFFLTERADHTKMITLVQEDLEALQEEELLLEKELEDLKREIESLQAEKKLVMEDIEEEKVFELKGLVEVRDLDSDLEVDLKYATKDNFTGRRLYPVEVCLLRKGTAQKLAAANAEFMSDGYRLKIWDAYRPLNVQEVLWEHKPDPVYVAHPDSGSNHNRGAAVDVTLVDEEGRELEMPTGFDVFTEEASRSYPDMPREARENMEYLTRVMVRNGFTTIESEWWHFNDADIAEYRVIDLDLEDFVAAYFSR